MGLVDSPQLHNPYSGPVSEGQNPLETKGLVVGTSLAMSLVVWSVTVWVTVWVLSVAVQTVTQGD